MTVMKYYDMVAKEGYLKYPSQGNQFAFSTQALEQSWLYPAPRQAAYTCPFRSFTALSAKCLPLFFLPKSRTALPTEKPETSVAQSQLIRGTVPARGPGLPLKKWGRKWALWARPGVLLHCIFQVEGRSFLLGHRISLTAAPVSAFAFEFSGSGHVCAEQGMWHIWNYIFEH